MKIRPPTDLVAGSKAAGDTAPERTHAKGAQPAAAPGAGQDRAQISALSAQLHALEASPGAEFDRARVEDIKQAIRDGSLVVNPQVIADRMLTSDLALVTNKP